MKLKTVLAITAVRNPMAIPEMPKLCPNTIIDKK